MALKEGLIFGRDFIFTYGPLGFLTARLPFEGNGVKLLLFDIFIYANLLFILYSIVKSRNSLLLLIILLLLFFIAGSSRYYMEPPIVLALYVIFYGFRFERTGRYGDLILALASSLLAFYIKLNTGLITLIILFLFIVAANFQEIYSKGNYKKAFIDIGIVFASIAISSSVLPVDFVPYLISSLQIADGYNDAMYIYQDKNRHFVFFALGLIATYSFVCLCYFKTIVKSLPNLLHFLIITGTLFVLFKQSFVRADDHVYTFFEFTPFVFALWLLFCDQRLKGPLFLITILSIGITFKAIDFNFSTSIIKSRVMGFQRYIQQYTSIDPATVLKRAPEQAKLPSSFMDKIRTGSVDIIPHEISLIYFNYLKYKPRPVMQSYSAYTPYLDQLGADLYSSNLGPDFVIFTNECIDERYCFFDESKLKLALLSNYSLVDRTDEMLLFARKNNPDRYTKSKLSVEEGRFGKEVKVSSVDQLLYLNTNIQYTAAGMLRRFLYKPPLLTIRFRINGELTRKFRLIHRLINDGVFISHFIQSSDDAALFFASDITQLKKIEGFIINSRDKSAYKRKFEYSFDKVVLYRE